MAHEELQSGAVVDGGNALSRAWDRRREKLAAQIERAALGFMAARGVDAVTVEEIAFAVGLSRRSFYRYFDSVDDILRAPLRRNLDLWAREFRSLPASEPLIVSIYTAITRATEPVEDVENLHLALAIMDASPNATKRVRAAMQAYCFELYFDLMSEKLARRGEDVRAAAPVSAALAAVMFQVADDCAREGVKISVDRIDFALAALVNLLGETSRIGGNVSPIADRRTPANPVEPARR